MAAAVSPELVVAGDAQAHAKAAASSTGRQFITSEVFQDPVEWYQRSLLIPHEVLRCGMADMERVLNPKFFPGTLQQNFKVKNFFRWYREYFFNYTHDHHDSEELVFIPWIKTRAAIPPKVQDDHVGLMKSMNELLEFEGKFDAALTRPTAEQERTELADKLRAAVADFVIRMRAHLREEEEIVPPLLRDHFTEKEEAAQVDKIIAHIPMSRRGEALAWVVRIARQWMTAAEQTEFARKLPPPVRFLLGHKWAAKHLRNNVQLLESVTQNVPPPPASACCTIA